MLGTSLYSLRYIFFIWYKLLVLDTETILPYTQMSHVPIESTLLLYVFHMGDMTMCPFYAATDPHG